MAVSYSSHKLNGCSICAPSLVLFSLGASTSQGKAGYIRNANYYSSTLRTVSFSLFTGSEPPCTLSGETAGGGGSSSESALYNYEIDVFGNIAIYTTSSTGTTYTYWSNNPNQDASYSESGGSVSINTVGAGTKCNPTQTTTTSNCSNYGEGNEGDDCRSIDCNFMNPESCTTSTSETSETISCSITNDCGANDQCTDTTTFSNLKNLSFFYGLCQSSASTKISILTNNEPQNCAGTKCGAGGKDDCWGSGGCFGITNNGLSDPNAISTTAQKLKFKIGTAKEGFSKKYNSVSGKVKFYYGGTGGKTPCCNEDFDGTVVKEAGYSISAGSTTFKNDYLASDAGDFDNSNQGLVGQTICSCFTVDNVSFI